MQMCPDNAKNQGKKSPFTQDIFGFLLNKLYTYKYPVIPAQAGIHA